MEKKEKKSMRISTAWVIITAALIFYFITLIIVFHYSKKGGLLYAIGVPFTAMVVAAIVGWRFSGSGNSNNAAVIEKPEPAKETKKETSPTPKVVTQKEGGFWNSVGNFFSGILKMFGKVIGLLFFLLMLSIVIFYFNGNQKIKDMSHGKGVGGIIHVIWDGLWQDNNKEAKDSLKLEKEANRHKEAMKQLETQADLAKKVKKTNIFGTTYEYDSNQSYSQENRNTSTNSGSNPASTTSTNTQQGYTQQQVVVYPDAQPIGQTIHHY